MQESFDVLVIGSGAGGGPIACRLAEAGLRVLVLEKGPEYSRAEYVHDEIAIVRRDFFVPSIQDEPHTLVWEDATTSQKTTMGWIACCVGGGTVHMAGYFYRLHPDDFRMRSKYGVLADWPFPYEELEPYYTQVEEEIGVSGASGQNPLEGPRSKPYPLPPVDVHPFSSEIDRSCAKLGLHPFPSPRAILSRPYKGRAACVYCDFCGSYGCEVGAKSSTQEALLPRAVATGRCEVRSRAMVHRIVARGGEAQGVLYFDAEGRERFAGARTVVLSANAIESARLLLASELGGALVGKNLQFSVFSTGRAVYRYAAQKRRQSILRTRHPFLGRSVQDFYFLPELPVPKGGTIRFGFPHANPIFTAMRLAEEVHPPRWGSFLKERMREYFHESRTVEFETFADFLPNPGTYVDLDPEVRDRWGLPVARLHVNQPAHHAEAARILQARGLEILEATEPDEVHPGELSGVTGHLLQGTCRAGKDPADSVLDRCCRLWDARNLYVVDGSFMPTAGGVPSTLTIMANSFRVADLIRQSVGDNRPR